MNNANFPRLVGDIGGTHARFAWVEHERAAPARVRTYRCAEHPGIEQAIDAYLADEGLRPPAACALGLANPVSGDRIRMTNNHWAFSREALQRRLGVSTLALLNDFTALALALPALERTQLLPLGGMPVTDERLRHPVEPLALLGAGTGLGVSGLVPTPDGRLIPLSGEGGHASLPATEGLQAAVVERLRERFGHVSAERVLSGPGLVNLYSALAELAGRPVEERRSEDIVSAATAGEDALCLQAAELFWDFMASVAGNLVLTLGATGGVYLGGGLGPRLASCLAPTRFRRHFEGKGRLEPYLKPVPCFLISGESSPALLGASRALDA